MNRRTFDDVFVKHIDEYDNNNQKFSVLMFDIDDFKKVNDTYGHDIGDEVLKSFAKILKDNIRSSESIFRWGGEEIVALVKGTKSDAKVLAERCRKVVEDSTFKFDNKKIKFTVTCGISEYKKKDSINSLVERADEALYRGKNSGKNKVVIYTKKKES